MTGSGHFMQVFDFIGARVLQGDAGRHGTLSPGGKNWHSTELQEK